VDRFTAYPPRLLQSLGHLFEHLRDGVLLTDTKGMVVEANFMAKSLDRESTPLDLNTLPCAAHAEGL
jgi:hypothetical protein